MKKLFIVFAVSCALLIGCTKSSSKKDSNKDFLDKSIAEKLTVKELSSIIEDDSTFAGRYELIRSVYDNLPETRLSPFCFEIIKRNILKRQRCAKREQREHAQYAETKQRHRR